MKKENILMLDKIVNQKANELGFEILKPEHSDKIVSIYREDWHLFLEMHSPIVSPLSLQMTICIADKSVQMLFSLHRSLLIAGTQISSYSYPILRIGIYIGAVLWADSGWM